MSSSSTSNSYHHLENCIAREHIPNFRNLPFFIYFTSPYSPLPPHLTHLNLSAFFRHIPTEAVPLPPSPPSQRLILVETGYHYGYIIDRSPTRNTPDHTPTTSPSSRTSTNSYSSLPPLIPILQTITSPSSQTSTNSFSSLPPLIPVPQTITSTPPPSYSETLERLPRYRRPEARELIHRSIDTL